MGTSSPELAQFIEFDPVRTKCTKAELSNYLQKLSHFLETTPDDLDSSIVPSPIPNYSLVSSTDFFTPSVCDPELQGRIAAANVLSDIFAVGSIPINVLMIVGASTACTDIERTTVTYLMMKGFSAACHELGVKVTGGQTVLNPEFLIGGTAVALTPNNQLIRPTTAQKGDVIVLTKPLGTQVISNVAQWLEHASLSQKGYSNVSEHCLKQWKRLTEVYNASELAQIVSKSRHLANQMMARVNNKSAEVMHINGATCCTDVTGFGILGHASNLAERQTEDVDFVLDKLPCYQAAIMVNSVVDFGLSSGFSPETSGGLMFTVAESKVEQVVSDLKQRGEFAFVVGKVVKGSRRAYLSGDVEIFAVDV
ncbi:hypothetical protein RCL1_003413 [Eukaryota sp. TZLM3-RCL]